MRALRDRVINSFRSGQGPGARMLRGLSHASLITVIGLPLAFATQITLARALGTEDYGIYAFVLSLLNMAVIYATLGLDNVSLREVSAFTGAEDWSGVRGFAVYSYRMTVLTSMALSAVGAVVLFLWPGIDGPTFKALAVLPLLLPLTAMMALQTSMLQSTGGLLEAQLPSGAVRPTILIALLVGAVFIAGHKLSSAQVLLLSTLAALSSVLLSDYLLRRRCQFAPTRAPQAAEKKEWLRLGRSLLGISTFQMAASQQLGIFMIGLLKAKRDAGIYSAANQVALPVSLGVGAVLFVAAPMLAQYYAQNRRLELQRTLHLSVLGAVTLSLPALLIFVFIGRWALGWYGPDFKAGYSILLVLSLSHVIVSLGGGIGGYLLSVSGNENANLRITAISAVVNFILVVALVSHLGMLGVAIAFTAATFLRFVLIARYIHQKMDLSLIPFHRPAWLPRRGRGVGA